MNYSVLPKIKDPATPAERNLLSEYTESVCYGYKEYERIVNGMRQRKEKLEKARAALLIFFPLFCLVHYCRVRRSKQIVEYTYRKNELENAVIYNYYDIDDEGSVDEDDHDDCEDVEVKVIDVDDHEMEPIME